MGGLLCTCCYRTPRRVNIQINRFLRVLRLEEEELRYYGGGGGFIHRAVETDDAFLEEAREDVVCDVH